MAQFLAISSLRWARALALGIPRQMTAFITVWFVLAYLLAATVAAFTVLLIGAGVRGIWGWWRERSGDRSV